MQKSSADVFIKKLPKATPMPKKQELRYLLDNLRKSIELWFLTNRDGESQQNTRLHQSNLCEDASFVQIQASTVAILQHGLHQKVAKMQARKNSSHSITSSSSSSLSLASLNGGAAAFVVATAAAAAADASIAADDMLKKLIDDFEWLRKSAQLRDSQHHDVDADDAITASHHLHSSTIEEFLYAWTLNALRTQTLCSCLQALVADKELLESYYITTAYLRNDAYATALFICLSAFDLRQRSLLSQINPKLYRDKLHVPADAYLRRWNSHPNFSLSPAKMVVKGHRKSCGKTQVDGSKEMPKTKLSTPPKKFKRSPSIAVYPTFRKVKSLPALDNVPLYNTDSNNKRPRSKTLSIKPDKVSLPKTIPNITSNSKRIQNQVTASCSSTHSGEDDTQPSTSASSKVSKSTLASYTSESSNKSGKSSESSTSTAAQHIQLIKCDDIKIWTDQNWEREQQQQHLQLQSTPKQTTKSFHIPPNLKQGKSISPINSFLSSLFSTPPAAESWYSQHKTATSYLSDDTASTVYPCNPCHDPDGSITSSVFDSFLPKYGQKLPSRKSQSLFDESNTSAFEQKCFECRPSAVTGSSRAKIETADQAICSIESEEHKSSNADMTATNNDSSTSTRSNQRKLTDCQSLTAFLQMAQLSRNNTELEKENAHFRISEVIISAIEHIKWAKLEPDKLRKQDETTTAMDWLESEQYKKFEQNKEAEVHSYEYIPYGGLGESCSELPSAEVVGLCLISKFNDCHLPKVSELKWLVAEEDTPQNLLPMPDRGSSENPDDNVMPSVTRGTKYWAPPRQQIIFTDHPAPNRKELIHKQNYRCAGCGMRVSAQYLKSFRYCTYLGKYHCTGCHRNQITATPAKILNAWDFKCYPVSVFAYRLLDQMYAYPLFHVPDLNPALYLRSKQLLSARTKRVELSYIKDFIKTCRFAIIQQQYFESIPDYVCSDPDTWSMSDFVDANNKSLQRYITDLIAKCEYHIFNCVLCAARGFICEHCNQEDILFPWQSKVYRCDRCGTCFHQNCWKYMQNICCRCQRLQTRQDEMSEENTLKTY